MRCSKVLGFSLIAAAAASVAAVPALADSGGVQLVTGLEPASMVTSISALAVPALLAIAGVSLSVGWFGAIVRKFAGVGRRV